MVFTYFYKTSDGVRHEATIDSPSREAAFSALRKIGIRPIKVIAPDKVGNSGSKKKAIALASAITAAVLSFAFALILFLYAQAKPKAPSSDSAPSQRISHNTLESQVVELKLGDRVAKPIPRRYIPSLAGTIASTNFFERKSENLLAKFAMPGVPVDDTTVETAELIEDFFDSLESDIIIKSDDPGDVATLKRIVAGLKSEAELYLRNGSGLTDFFRFLKERQRMESEYRQNVIRDNSRSDANSLLKSLGFREIDTP